MTTVRNADQFIAAINDKLIHWRRQLHQIPEVGWCEYQTTSYIFEQLKETAFDVYVGKEIHSLNGRYGLPTIVEEDKFAALATASGVQKSLIEQMKGGFTGVVAQLKTGRPGKHFAFRFDIDALPLEESNTDQHLPHQKHFHSNHDGVMHACAHDGHAAIGLGLAAFLNEHKDELNGTYTMIFQPAEEGGRGAKSIVEKGWLKNVDYFLSGHIGIHSHKIGQIAATTSHILATTKLNVTFTGLSAHAGVEPHKGKNALLAAATATVHLYTIAPHASGDTRINVGKLEGGRGRNIVADHAQMEIETRGETDTENQYMLTQARRIIEAAAKMNDVDVKMEVVGEAHSTEVDNDFFEKFKKATESSRYVQQVVPSTSLNGSEDVTYMMNEVRKNGGKATYMNFGTPLKGGHHQRDFDFDEKVLAVAVNSLCCFIIQEQE